MNLFPIDLFLSFRSQERRHSHRYAKRTDLTRGPRPKSVQQSEEEKEHNVVKQYKIRGRGKKTCRLASPERGRTGLILSDLFQIPREVGSPAIDLSLSTYRLLLVPEKKEKK